MLNKCIFLDRDGVINNNQNSPFTHDRQNFIINDGVIEFIREVRLKGYRVIIISNQGGIALKYYPQSDTEDVHAYFLDQLEKHGTTVDEIYYCPHHHQVEKCICRKPDSLMLEKAIARFQINPSKSYFFGDNTIDVKAGKKAGIAQSIKIEANEDLTRYINHIN